MNDYKMNLKDGKRSKKVKTVPERALQFVARASTYGLSKGSHVTRYFMYQHLAGFRPMMPADQVLSIGGSETLCKILGFNKSSISDASYPEVDMLDLPFADGEFNCVVSDQVLEHVKGTPQNAINESFRVIKPGGFVVHTTCFINPIHMNPGDYWRFTPDALRLMIKDHGEVIVADGWGNPFIWPYILIGLRFEPIPHARWHSLNWLATYNHPDWPVSTWILAKKYIS